MEKQLESLKSERKKRKRTNRQTLLAEYMALKAFDRGFLGGGAGYLAGVDEAGRGALAGPVVAAAVVLPAEPGLVGVNDSKRIGEEEREQLFSQIVRKALSVGIAAIKSGYIDKNNILVATLSAMSRAIRNLKVKPEIVLIDGRDTVEVPARVIAVPGGDGKSLSIAAASIVAKVTRDRLMRKLHRKYPLYNFLKNKGYGTVEHVDAICRYGMISEHRRSYHVKSIEKNPEMF